MMNRYGYDNVAGRVPATFPGLIRGNANLVPVIPKTDFSFDGRSSTLQDVPLATGIDSSSWVSAVLAVRIHAKGTFSATGKAVIMVQNIMLVPEEPDVVYVAPTDLTGGNLTISSAAADAAGVLKVLALTGPIGPMLRVLLRFDQGATAAGAAQTFTMSVDLVGRQA